MKAIQTRATTSPQGVLSINLPTGLPSTDVGVILILSEATRNGTPVPGAPPADPASWNRFVDETAGAWRGGLVRPPRGDDERRDPLG